MAPGISKERGFKMKLTDEINTALARIIDEDHVVQNGVRDALFDSVGPIFDVEASFFPLRPSSCLKPLRDLYYDLVNFYAPGTIPKAPFENRIKLIFQFGHLTETLLKKVFAYTYGVQMDQQRVVYGELIDKDGNKIVLGGNIDWCSKLGGNELILCDAKSIGDFPFKKAPKAENISQMQLYMHSDIGRKHQLNKALLIYFNKNTSDIKCIEVPYDPILAEKLLERLKYVWECYKSGTVPPREHVLSVDWEANYSAYREYDNKEFELEIFDRETIEVEGKCKKLKSHVLEYGNKIVLYDDGAFYAKKSGDKLVLLEKDT